MDTTNIINALKQERDRIDAAIAALSSGTAGNGRRRRGNSVRAESTPTRRRPRRRLSAAARKRISDAAKTRWAKAKKAGRSSL